MMRYYLGQEQLGRIKASGKRRRDVVIGWISDKMIQGDTYSMSRLDKVGVKGNLLF
jgi:hypothetical protein